MTAPFCFGIAGWKNSGKTSLLAGLVSELAGRDLTVSTVKHAHHSFDLDVKGSDSYKHREAGAREVMLVSENRWAIQHELGNQPEPDFETVVQKLSPCDIVLVEGYKREKIPKLEIIAPESIHESLWSSDSTIRAIATDNQLAECSLPQFARSDIIAIADFILSQPEYRS